MNSNSDINLKNQLERTFIQKEVDLNSPSVIASLVSAASGMTLAADTTMDSEITRNEILELYGQSENESLRNMSYLNSNYVKANIGYSVQFEDYERARTCYLADKENYDTLYAKINNRFKSHEQVTGKSL